VRLYLCFILFDLYLDDVNIPKLKPINLSSPVYADLSNTIVEFSLTNINLCIGSLQIKSLGNFDYLLNNDNNTYPNKYSASRLFWSTKNARQKTVYHLHIEIEQTYHDDKSNHQTIEYPLSNERLHLEQLYEICRNYFNTIMRKKENIIQSRDKSSLITSEKNVAIDTKTLRNLFINNSNHSQFTLALAQALQHVDQSSSAKLYVVENFPNIYI
jgi:hypothetical protein